VLPTTDDRQTDDRRQTTDGRATAYSEREREFTFAKNLIILTVSEKKISAMFQPRVQLVPPYTNGPLIGDPAPHSMQPLPIFGPCLLWPKGRPSEQLLSSCYCCQTAGCIKMPLGMEVGLSSGDFVFDGDPPAPRTEGTPATSQFLAHVYCVQTAGRVKTPLGTEVDLGSGHIVLDGVPALRQRGTAALSAACVRFMFGRSFVKRFAYAIRPLSVCYVCLTVSLSCL